MNRIAGLLGRFAAFVAEAWMDHTTRSKRLEAKKLQIEEGHLTVLLRTVLQLLPEAEKKSTIDPVTHSVRPSRGAVNLRKQETDLNRKLAKVQRRLQVLLRSLNGELDEYPEAANRSFVEWCGDLFASLFSSTASNRAFELEGVMDAIAQHIDAVEAQRAMALDRAVRYHLAMDIKEYFRIDRELVGLKAEFSKTIARINNLRQNAVAA